MKRILPKLSAVALATLLIAPVAIHAQDEKDKDKDKSDKKDAEQIIITRKNADKGKVTVEIDGDKVLVNGKPIEDLKDGEITVNRHKIRDGHSAMAFSSPEGDWSYNWNDNDMKMLYEDGNTAMLGVVTESEDDGLKITDITEGSGADKAGLKEDDIITKVDDKKVDDPDDLTKLIRSHKPGDKVNITYLRDKKEQKVTAELGKWKGSNFNAFNMPNMDFNMIVPKTEVHPKIKIAPGQYYSFSDNRPKLGLSVQDTEDGKGVKVIDVDDEGNGKKAGVKENDIITAINDKVVNSADEVARIVRESRDKPSLMLKIKRAGKIQNIEVRMPRKLKTADL
jgi:serine protease Do